LVRFSLSKLFDVTKSTVLDRQRVTPNSRLDFERRNCLQMSFGGKMPSSKGTFFITEGDIVLLPNGDKRLVQKTSMHYDSIGDEIFAYKVALVSGFDRQEQWLPVRGMKVVSAA